MKVRKLIKKLHEAIFEHNKEKEKRVWFKILKKSTKHKHTEAVR